jgi:hypothetical protein
MPGDFSIKVKIREAKAGLFLLLGMLAKKWTADAKIGACLVNGFGYDKAKQWHPMSWLLALVYPRSKPKAIRLMPWQKVGSDSDHGELVLLTNALQVAAMVLGSQV